MEQVLNELGTVLNELGTGPGLTYALSVFGGAIVTFLWSRSLHWGLSRKFVVQSQKRVRESVRWIPVVMGLFERTLITTFVLYLPNAVGPFAGAWITIKAVGGWGLFKEPTGYSRALFMIGLLGSAMSILWAVAIGLIIQPISN